MEGQARLYIFAHSQKKGDTANIKGPARSAITAFITAEVYMSEPSATLFLQRQTVAEGTVYVVMAGQGSRQLNAMPPFLLVDLHNSASALLHSGLQKNFGDIIRYRRASEMFDHTFKTAELARHESVCDHAELMQRTRREGVTLATRLVT